MKRFVEVLFLLLAIQFFLSCKTSISFKSSKIGELETYRNSLSDGNHFSDSLLNSGIDTFMSYSEEGGFMSGLTHPYYIFWIDQNQGYLTKFDDISNYNILKADFDLDFISSIKDSLSKPVINNIDWNCSDCAYQAVKIKIDSFNYSIRLLGGFRSSKFLSYPDITIDKFRSFLLIHEGYWTPLSNRINKKGKRGRSFQILFKPKSH